MMEWRLDGSDMLILVLNYITTSTLPRNEGNPCVKLSQKVIGQRDSKGSKDKLPR